MKRVVLVGGGTAGHVEPALAVGRWFTKNTTDVDLEFIGTKSGIEVELLVDTGIKFSPINKVPFPRKLRPENLFWPFKFSYAVFKSIVILRGANLVIGFGGYVSAPVYIAAWLLRIPIIIHEANAMPGMANKLGSYLAKQIFTAFEGAKAFGNKWAASTNVGMPIKEGIDHFANQNLIELRHDFLISLGLDPSKKTLLIFGGSIGAKQINSAILAADAELARLDWNIIHSVGIAVNPTKPTANYRAVNYILNMTAAYAASDFVIARSGAVTCAELQATGIPALLVPLPIGNGEQEANAAELVATGQATKVANFEFTDSWVRANLANLLKVAPERRLGVSRDAAEKIGKFALTLIEKI